MLEHINKTASDSRAGSSGITIISLILCATTITLHSIGSYLLISIYRESGRRKPEQLYLINFSVCGLLFTTAHILCTPIETLVTSPLDPNVMRGIAAMQGYMEIVDSYGGLMYHVCMMCLTVDRLLEILLDLNYHRYCSTQGASRILKLSWLCVLVLTIAMLAMYRITGQDVVLPLLMYVLPSFDLCFIVTAFAVYGFLFARYRASRVPPVQTSLDHSSVKSQMNLIRVFRTSRFHVPVLLIASFLLFIVTPDVLYVLFTLGVPMNAVLLSGFYRVAFVISCFSDVLIYLFMDASVKRMILKKLNLYRVRI